MIYAFSITATRVKHSPDKLDTIDSIRCQYSGLTCSGLTCALEIIEEKTDNKRDEFNLYLVRNSFHFAVSFTVNRKSNNSAEGKARANAAGLGYHNQSGMLSKRIVRKRPSLDSELNFHSSFIVVRNKGCMNK